MDVYTTGAAEDMLTGVDGGDFDSDGYGDDDELDF